MNQAINNSALTEVKTMEKASLVCYEQNPETSFFLCRQCQTHLALNQELLHKYETNQHALFRDLVNVGLGANYQIVTGQTGAPVCCINCNSILGSKFVALNIETSAIKAGRFVIDLQDEDVCLERNPDAVCRHRGTSSECIS